MFYKTPCRNTNNSYGCVSKFFHWAIFFLVVPTWMVGQLFALVPVIARGPVFAVHAWVGTLVGLLMLCRWLWRWANPVPELPSRMPRWQQQLAQGIHHLFYLVLLAMPCAGWVMLAASNHPMSFFGKSLMLPWVPHNRFIGQWAFQVHSWLGWLFMGMLVLHVMAAWYHRFMCRDNIYERMVK